MDSNKVLLESVYKGSSQGLKSAEVLSEMEISEEIKQKIDCQKEEYRRFNDSAAEIMNARGYEVSSIGVMESKAAQMYINWKMLSDKSDAKIAEMVIKSNIDGIIEGTKALKRSVDADEEIKSLAGTFLEREKENFNNMLCFL